MWPLADRDILHQIYGLHFGFNTSLFVGSVKLSVRYHPSLLQVMEAQYNQRRMSAASNLRRLSLFDHRRNSAFGLRRLSQGRRPSLR
ncbi:hypothetical protein PoB_002657100 [Plakobranchus ocellatus]|uniref:Uncharacterized protein n=1 Tax=Plakobranchus ocellatus TaxID=259542 RepID=A0AAV3ZVU9_9GAST|nr:hypothetical protein PoB_002657100 [Plakobranchus ocellatus]